MKMSQGFRVATRAGFHYFFSFSLNGKEPASEPKRIPFQEETNSQSEVLLVNATEEMSEPITIVYEEQQTDDDFAHVDTLHWTHMPLTYYIEEEQYCGTYEPNRRPTQIRIARTATPASTLRAPKAGEDRFDCWSFVSVMR